MHESHDIFARMSATAPLPRGLYRDMPERVSRPDGNELEFTIGENRYRASLWRDEIEVQRYQPERGIWYRVSTSGARLPVAEVQSYDLDMTPAPGPSWLRLMLSSDQGTRVAVSLLHLSLAVMPAETRRAISYRPPPDRGDTMTPTTYSFTFRSSTTPIPDGVQTEGTLQDAIELAATYDATILLTDAPGFDRGFVKPDGTWSLN